MLAQRPEEGIRVFCHPLSVLLRHDLSLNLKLTFSTSQKGPEIFLLVLGLEACVEHLYVGARI